MCYFMYGGMAGRGWIASWACGLGGWVDGRVVGWVSGWYNPCPCRLTVAHKEHSVFKPHNVSVKNVKVGNSAGFIGTTVLKRSRYLTPVWRGLAS